MKLCRSCNNTSRRFCLGTLLIGAVALWSIPSSVYVSMLSPQELDVNGAAAAATPARVSTPRQAFLHVLPASDPAPAFLQGTSLQGDDVRRFRAHLDCFSQTGKWAHDNTPRAMCCKVKVYHTANFTRCEPHPYCRAHPDTVYASPLLGARALAEGHPWTVRDELKWVWQTSPSCPLLPFDREKFCKKIGRGRNLLISGDSISYQVFITFLNFLRSELSETQYPFHGLGKEPVCADVLGGDGFDLAWICSPLLNKTEITPYLEEWNIKILFMNRGAWFRADYSVVGELRGMVSVLQARYPHLLVIYRNTIPGHKGCVDLHGPLDQPQEKTNLPYHWGEFARQNEMARKIIDRARFIFLDVDTMLSLRPDGHMGPPRDCLHYSIPGPLDVVFHLFYNTILLL